MGDWNIESSIGYQHHGAMWGGDTGHGVNGDTEEYRAKPR